MPFLKPDFSSEHTRPLTNITQKMTLAYGAIILIPTSTSILVVENFSHAILIVCLAIISIIMVFFLSHHFGQVIKKLIDRLVTDINEHQQTQEALKQALKQAKQAAEEADFVKHQFLLNIGHELRTPLCPIIGYSEMLIMDAKETGLDHVAKEKGFEDFVGDLNHIHAAGQHLLGLINELIDLSKLGTKKIDIDYETFELSKVLHEIIGIIQPLLEIKGNTLQVEIDERLGKMYSDKIKIREIIFHLLSHRTKLTEQGLIIFKVTRRKEIDLDWVTFQLSDTGIGLTQKEIGKIFLPFAFNIYPYENIEIGLMIARQFIEMIGGHLTIESELGQGIIYTVQLPAKTNNNK